MTSRRLWTAVGAASLLLGGVAAQGGPMDGMHDFSVDGDQHAAGGANSGQINVSAENGSWGDDFVITPLGANEEIDALSSHHRGGPWNHKVTLERMLKGDLRMNFSVDNDGNIFEWSVSGPEPVPNGTGRLLTPDGHEPATPNPINWKYAHDNENTLFGTDRPDLDALEDHDHLSPPSPRRYPYPYPGAPTDWEKNHQNVYFSTEKGTDPASKTYDPGDVFNWGLSSGAYVDDTWICQQLNAATGYQNCSDTLFNIDALVVFDVTGLYTSFDAGPTQTKWDSDAIFFSLDPNSGIKDSTGNLVDPNGDVIWWVSAASTTTNPIAGVYGYGNLGQNLDALDVHVPEPTSLALLGLGLAGLGRLRRRQDA